MNTLNEDAPITKKEFMEYLVPVFEELKWGQHTSNKKLDDLKDTLADEIYSLDKKIAKMKTGLTIKIQTNTIAVTEAHKDIKLLLRNKDRIDSHENRISNVEKDLQHLKQTSKNC